MILKLSTNSEVSLIPKMHITFHEIPNHMFTYLVALSRQITQKCKRIHSDNKTNLKTHIIIAKKVDDFLNVNT
ncbi:conserved hypothetical protein [Vibrio diabolicus]|nr:conserved hypothetical protein [Vibrio diabolicus]